MLLNNLRLERFKSCGNVEILVGDEKRRRLVKYFQRKCDDVGEWKNEKLRLLIIKQTSKFLLFCAMHLNFIKLENMS